MEVSRAVTAGIRINSNLAIPVIKVEMANNSDFTRTDEESHEINQSLSGTVCTSAIFTQQELQDRITSLSAGTVIYGNDDGFKLVYSITSMGTGESPKRSECKLYYKGAQVASAYTYTGYGTFEVCPLTIYVNENNIIFYDTRQTSESSCIEYYSEYPGFAVAGSNIITSVIASTDSYGLGSLQTHFSLSEFDISEEITYEDEGNPTDPFRRGGTSETGGGNGDFDRSGGSVNIPDLPSLSAADAGFITLFNPTTAQLKNLATYMWSGGFDIDTFKKIVADPMECILGLSIVPVNIPSGGTSEVTIGNIGTGVSMTKASSQFVVKNCGSLNMREYWGSYLDYAPYTKVTSLYLPYIGVVSVDADIIMNKTIGVVYHVDVLSGQCIAYITVNGNVNFQYQGACSVSIPVTSVDYSSMISAGLSIASTIAGIGAAGATGGMMLGGPAGAAIGAAGAAMSAVPSIANNVMRSKPDIKSGGSIGGMGGMMGVQYPYIMIEWPRQSVAARQNTFTGYPSNIRARLGSLSGYTECDMVKMDKVSCTDSERAEIENLLKGGVYL